MTTLEIPHEIITSKTDFICLKLFGGLAFYGYDLSELYARRDAYLKKLSRANKQVRITFLQNQILCAQEEAEGFWRDSHISELLPHESARYAIKAGKMERLIQQAQDELSTILRDEELAASAGEGEV